MEEIEVERVKFELAEYFLVELKKKFRGGDDELAKVAELKRVEQGRKTMEEFV